MTFCIFKFSEDLFQFAVEPTVRKFGQPFERDMQVDYVGNLRRHKRNGCIDFSWGVVRAVTTKTYKSEVGLKRVTEALAVDGFPISLHER